MTDEKPDLLETLERAQAAVREGADEAEVVHASSGGLLDRFFIWGHEKFVPTSWCAEDPGHWTWKIVDALWIDCACCFMFRSMFIGAALASSIWGAIGVLLLFSY